jgi:SET domain-containing protein
MRAVFPKVIIELGRSQIDGVGVFAVRSFLLHARLARGIAEAHYKRLIDWDSFAECDADVRKRILAFCIGTPEGFIPPDDFDFNKLSIEWYFNHSCEGNVGFNERGDFVARRKIEKGEELLYDYGLAESNPRFRMECSCGSSNCRKIITGNDWRDTAFRENNLEYMLPRLRREHYEKGTVALRRVADRRH